MHGMCDSSNRHKDYNLAYWLLSYSALGKLRNLTLLPLLLWFMFCLDDIYGTFGPMNLWTYGHQRQNSVLSKTLLCPATIREMTFPLELPASVKLMDIFCIGYCSLSNRKTTLRITQLCWDDRIWSIYWDAMAEQNSAVLLLCWQRPW